MGRGEGSLAKGMGVLSAMRFASGRLNVASMRQDFHCFQLGLPVTSG